MSFPYYRPGIPEPKEPVEVLTEQTSRREQAAKYRPDDGLVAAVNVALALGQPLLVTGEPGTGKTLLAYHVSRQLGWGDPLAFEAKSSSTASDLFYVYDALSRFHAAAVSKSSLSEIRTSPPASGAQAALRPGVETERDEQVEQTLAYLKFQALGAAILLAAPFERVKKWWPKNVVHNGPRRSVVLIDEVDKAPRDFPNDILNEIERMRFNVPELGNEPFEAPPSYRPVVIITSNSEKNLPDAFLRRCIYYDIPFPDDSPQGKKRMMEIIGSHLPKLPPYIEEAIEYFYVLRRPQSGLAKKPATAELLGWLNYIPRRLPDASVRLRANSEVLAESLSILVKSAPDQKIASELLSQWCAGKLK